LAHILYLKPANLPRGERLGRIWIRQQNQWCQLPNNNYGSIFLSFWDGHRMDNHGTDNGRTTNRCRQPLTAI